MSVAAANAILPRIVELDPAQIWFGRCGYVLRTDVDTYSVMVGDTLVGTYTKRDVATRDVLIVIVVRSIGAGVAWREVAAAFRVGRATVGRAMQRFSEGGLAAVADMGHQGGVSKRTPQLDKKVFGLFERGLGVRAAHRVVAKRISYGTVQAMHQEWLGKQPEAAAANGLETPAQFLVDVQNVDDVSNDNETPAARQAEEPTHVSAVDSTRQSIAAEDPLGLLPEPSARAMQRKERAPEELISEGKTELVQHAGTWILLALLNALGVYAEAERWSGKVSRVTLRVVIDAAACALALGQGCVEGVRRLATPSAALLLRHEAPIGPNWVRRVLGRFAKEAALMFRAQLTATLLRRNSEARESVYLYVDNHMRRYTGKHTIRKGWRMQDKRAVPGTTDYYVHDEDGAPLWRATSNDHESLSAWLPRTLGFARHVLGAEPEIVLSFDRGGAFPETLAGLRDLGGSFVTYERKPYAPLATSEFTKRLTIVLPSRPREPIVIRYTEAPDKNLRKGRGRVRRIALLTEEGAQINLLTDSKAPADELIRKHLARWGNQENQLKHGVERWGMNQLDGRQVEPYPPDAIIPNPDRRRTEHKIALARAAEGKARCQLAELASDDPRRKRALEDIERAVARRVELEALRPSLPKRAPVKETSLAGKLQRHHTEYKDVLDTLRIACANIEADLATAIAHHLERPREAKKVIANLFAATATVRLGASTWRVRLMPAATRDERHAIAELLRTLNRQNLVLPGDPTRRRLHFSLARSSHS